MLRSIGLAFLGLLALAACSPAPSPAATTAGPSLIPTSSVNVSPTPSASPVPSLTPSVAPSASSSPLTSSGALGAVEIALTGKAFSCGSGTALSTRTCRLIGTDGVTYQIDISGTDKSPVVVVKVSGKSGQALAGSNMPELVALAAYAMGGNYAQVNMYLKTNAAGSGATVVFGNTRMKIERTADTTTITLSLTA